MAAARKEPLRVRFAQLTPETLVRERINTHTRWSPSFAAPAAWRRRSARW